MVVGLVCKGVHEGYKSNFVDNFTILLSFFYERETGITLSITHKCKAEIIKNIVPKVHQQHSYN